jgi:hypothetical protein
MAKEKIRVSRTGVTSGGRIALYTNSKEVSDLDPSLVRFIAGNSLSPLSLTTGGFEDDLYSSDTAIIVEGSSTNLETEKVIEENNNSESNNYKIPSASDIQILSQQVVYDSAGLPSVTVIFKIKNSSGVELKGMNARIELL